MAAVLSATRLTRVKDTLKYPVVVSGRMASPALLRVTHPGHQTFAVRERRGLPSGLSHAETRPSCVAATDTKDNIFQHISNIPESVIVHTECSSEMKKILYW